MSEDNEMARRNNPDYPQVCGRVHRSVVEEMKIECIRSGINQSEALEKALRLWLSVENSRKKEEESDRHAD
ncbi:hypothetical protein PMG71_09605 [Roseofilum sp. BLCC_M154]|uniref:Ribbon-helix-helix protein CopG domain-containing protein n=1 Tax=Roseofilum acuticapitatum BLCC-M154 TaxID=3022444 RepID=A0ABT7AS01_9CYAN|nr:hypothetical protein [Roseofilum acuticapitatum]MDJ1169681.1 hypothetical protein [Roseofilum acuticapitatum BLCC-M154]